MKAKDLNVFQAGTKYMDLTYPPVSGSGESWNMLPDPSHDYSSQSLKEENH